MYKHWHDVIFTSIYMHFYYMFFAYVTHAVQVAGGAHPGKRNAGHSTVTRIDPILFFSSSLFMCCTIESMPQLESSDHPSGSAPCCKILFHASGVKTAG